MLRRQTADSDVVERHQVALHALWQAAEDHARDFRRREVFRVGGLANEDGAVNLKTLIEVVCQLREEVGACDLHEGPVVAVAEDVADLTHGGPSAVAGVGQDTDLMVARVAGVVRALVA
jgi:hypothetical protein